MTEPISGSDSLDKVDDNGTEGVGCYWVAGTLVVLALGIGAPLFYRWNQGNVEAHRSRSATIGLLRQLGTSAMLDYVDAHECLPKSVDDLVPYLESPGGYDGGWYRDELEQGRDAWVNPVRMYFDLEAGSVILVSGGPDEHENNGDDVVFVDDLLPDVPRCSD